MHTWTLQVVPGFKHHPLEVLVYIYRIYIYIYVANYR